MRDTHLEIASRNQTSPKDSHDIPSAVLALFDKSRTEPETLDEHRHHDELRKGRRESPNGVTFLGRSGYPIEGFGEGEFFVGACVEGFYGSDCGGTSVDCGGGLSGLVSLVCEVGAGEGLRETLDEDEEGDGGEDDESEEGGAHEGEDEACDCCG